MKPATRAYLRSVRGQLTLLAIVFAGAVMLAVVAVILRSWFFEPFVREWHSPTDVAGQLVNDLAGGAAGAEDITRAVEKVAEDMARKDKRVAGQEEEKPELLKRLMREQLPQARKRVLDACYFAWLEHPEADPHDRILKALLEESADDTILRFKRTLAVGNLEQRERLLVATAALARVDRQATLEFLGILKARAQRRGEAELTRRAEELMHALPQ